jgi:hypothetical protein
LKNDFLVKFCGYTAEKLSLSQNRKSAQKGAKRRQKAQKGDCMAEILRLLANWEKT